MEQKFEFEKCFLLVEHVLVEYRDRLKRGTPEHIIFDMFRQSRKACILRHKSDDCKSLPFLCVPYTFDVDNIHTFSTQSDSDLSISIKRNTALNQKMSKDAELFNRFLNCVVETGAQTYLINDNETLGKVFRALELDQLDIVLPASRLDESKKKFARFPKNESKHQEIQDSLEEFQTKKNG